MINPLAGATWCSLPPVQIDQAELPISLASGYRTPLPSDGFFTWAPRPGNIELLAFCVLGFVLFFLCFIFHSLLPMYLSQCGNFPLIPTLQINFLFANGCMAHSIF